MEENKTRFSTWVRHVGRRFDGWAQRFVPDPFVFALALTVVTFGVGLVWGFNENMFPNQGPNGISVGANKVLKLYDGTDRTDGTGGPNQKPDGVVSSSEWPSSLPQRANAMIHGWAIGFWELLAFSMQMCLILVTGFALAHAPIVKAQLVRLAEKPRTTSQAVVVTALVAMVGAWLNWGLGLIAGALLAREIGDRARKMGYPIHYPLVVAAGYMGLLVWHGGFSGSAPLKATNPAGLAQILGQDLATQIGGAIPLDQTVLSPLNGITAIGLLLVIPTVLAFLSPTESNVTPAPQWASPDSAIEGEANPHPTWAEKLNQNRWLVWVVVLGALWYLAQWIQSQGIQSLNLNIMNLTLLAAGLGLHGTPERYVGAIKEAAGACGGIILQFPFYAGIMGMMKYSGLVAVFASGLNEWVSPTLLPVATFFSAGFVNLFVPSGGGQFAVQGQIVVESALHADVPVGKMVLALAYGDQWTNMLQPFWAIPLLGITQLKAKDIVGFTAVVMLATLPVFLLPLLLL